MWLSTQPVTSWNAPGGSRPPARSARMTRATSPWPKPLGASASPPTASWSAPPPRVSPVGSATTSSYGAYGFTGPRSAPMKGRPSPSPGPQVLLRQHPPLDPPLLLRIRQVSRLRQDPRGDQDHQIVLRARLAPTAAQESDQRQVTEDRDLAVRPVVLLLGEAADQDGLAVLHAHGGGGSAAAQ